jgi:DNA-directed RNA polymerase subunit RPC12/RpoP
MKTNENDKSKALDVMIAIGAKKGLGMKEDGDEYKDSSMEEEDMKEDSSEDKMITCEECGHKMAYPEDKESE